MDQQTDTQQPTEQSSRRANALVFISHDSRDAEIAEAFSRLISSVSAGVLKSFRSSDKKGNQGIEYGIEWYSGNHEKTGDCFRRCLLTYTS